MTRELITTFYDGLAARDADSMVGCYHASVVFEDPAFGRLEADDAQAMWRMLCSADSDLRVRYEILDAGADEATVRWVADYTFPKTGRPVTNEITAFMRFADGKITHHTDTFDFWKWSSQALGLTGRLLGWTPFLRSKVQTTTRKQLAAFRARSL